MHVVVNARGQERAAKHPGKHYPFITDCFRAIGPAGFVQQSWIDIDERMLAEARIPNRGDLYYSNPGSPTAPRATVTGSLGFGTSGQGIHRVFLRKGMTSEVTLGYGVSGNLSSIVPSVTVNASIPDENNIPYPWKAKVSSIEAGVGTPGASVAATYTWTPQQIADFLIKHGMAGLDLLKRVPAPGPVGPASPAMGPEDELSPFARTLRSCIGTVGPATAPPIGYLSSRHANSVGNGMGD